MNGRCPHRRLNHNDVRFTIAGASRPIEMTMRWCRRCIDFVPMGPARVDLKHRVLIEVRAAEIACSAAARYGMIGDEEEGFASAANDSDRVTIDENSIFASHRYRSYRRLAGWLAYHIHHHYDELPRRQFPIGRVNAADLPVLARAMGLIP